MHNSYIRFWYLGHSCTKMKLHDVRSVPGTRLHAINDVMSRIGSAERTHTHIHISRTQNAYERMHELYHELWSGRAQCA